MQLVRPLVGRHFITMAVELEGRITNTTGVAADRGAAVPVMAAIIVERIEPEDNICEISVAIGNTQGTNRGTVVHHADAQAVFVLEREGGCGHAFGAAVDSRMMSSLGNVTFSTVESVVSICRMSMSAAS